MGVPPEVEAFLELLPGSWATTTETPDGERRGRCIESARVLTAVLGGLGVPARPVAADVAAFNAAAWEQFEAGVPASEWPEGCWSVGASADGDAGDGPSVNEPYRRTGWGGHLVVVGDGWFADPTVEQFHRPHRGIRITDAFVGPVEPDAAGVIAVDDHRVTIRWRFRPEVRAWRTTPAWRQDVSYDLVATVGLAVRRALAAPLGR